MKYTLSLAAALLATLALAGAALAKNQPYTSLVPRLSTHPHAWVSLLRNFPRDPKPLHHTAEQRRSPAAHRGHWHGTTGSVYEQSVQPWTLRAQGCSAARRHESGVVVLDFGKPAFERHGYGAILFSGRFALNHRITTAMVAWARGYDGCLASGSTAFVTLARGTSNYHPAVPSAYTAGLHWAGATNKFQRILERRGLAAHVASAAADDMEPAWDPGFRKTRDFVHGFRMGTRAHTLYDYGSLDGGVGAIWSARQVYYLAGGARHTAALPEIYYASQAREWAELAAVVHHRYHRQVKFAGVMTQGTSHCHCGFRPRAAHRALARALTSYGAAQTVLPVGVTNIGS